VIEIILLICGSRSIELDKELLDDIINKHDLKDITEVISGGARGPDHTAIIWARSKGIKCTVMKADWNKYGKKAGILRNREMAEMCDVCLSVWDGSSVGTASTMSFVEELNKPLYVEEYKEWIDGQ